MESDVNILRHRAKCPRRAVLAGWLTPRNAFMSSMAINRLLIPYRIGSGALFIELEARVAPAGGRGLTGEAEGRPRRCRTPVLRRHAARRALTSLSAARDSVTVGASRFSTRSSPRRSISASSRSVLKSFTSASDNNSDTVSPNALATREINHRPSPICVRS